MKNQKAITESIPFTIATKRIRYLGINLPKKTNCTQKNLGINLTKTIRCHKQMERCSMFLGKKNQYCENDYTTKCNLQIQCDPYQFTNDIFHRTRTKNFKIHMETQKTSNSQGSLEKEEWNWRNQTS